MNLEIIKSLWLTGIDVLTNGTRNQGRRAPVQHFYKASRQINNNHHKQLVSIYNQIRFLLTDSKITQRKKVILCGSFVFD